MTRTSGARRLTVALAAAAVLVLAACAVGPNTTFTPHTEFGRAEDDLWHLLLRLGTAVFIFVEALLLYAIIKFRHREGAPEPAHVHGNTRLEILWTVIPAVVLAFIAVPTVRTIFQTQAKAAPDALQVEVYGHQWWWEFRYPQYKITTAGELYLPIGRKVNFALHSVDVIHSFWTPQLGGKRDVIPNHTNYLWFTPDSTLQASAWNGSCNEYCGTSHANMKFRVYTVPVADFERWAAHQATPAVYPTPSTTTDSGYVFPVAQLPDNVIPHTPLPPAESFATGLTGDPAAGLKTYSTSACIGCHTITGNASSLGTIGPNLTHIASRHTIGAGLYPNDVLHLEYWIKNAHAMKAGATMLVFGKGEIDPQTGKPSPAGTLSDQQVADIVAYLQQLK
jgi:cytochrome c oxidase subunit II